MLVTSNGEAVGSVSGGCVEGALYEVGQEVLADGQPRYEVYGVSDDDAFAIGLTCGGILEVFIERVDASTWPELPQVLDAIASDSPIAVATMVKGDHVGRHLVLTPTSAVGGFGVDRLDDSVTADARGLLESGASGFLHYGPLGERMDEGVEIYVASYVAKPHLIIFGAIDFSAALTRVGKLLGYRVTVCDARPVFATKKRFPDADEVVVDWPHRWLATQEVDSRTAIAVLTHDPKFDVPALMQAFTTNAGYIGAMGSRRTHQDRVARLIEAGASEADLARICSPLGLELRARPPEETAISIAAEMINRRWGGTGKALSSVDGPIHTGVQR
jgi:xanthine dehydrogenase accessory factor